MSLNNVIRFLSITQSTLDLEITGVLYVSESSYTPYSPYRSYAEEAMDSGFAAPTPIIEGTLSVSVSVQVTFSFQ
ncbi:hypothetical protein MCGE09_00659 [Thaumarchaeota archaeon SCGC AB-539-E09]|nr:hypothetical protein MCGE09_00659 [Thaumarchaeota archaeon SCGC AB-539-E09]